MLLSVQRLTKFYSKIEKHHHHHRPEALPAASLQAFRSHISTSITHLLSNLNSEFDIPWIHQCFHLLPIANKAFANLIVDIEYPMTDWQAKSMEDYFNYSLELLDIFNSISASVAHLSHVRLSLLHAFSLLQMNPATAEEKMKAVAFESPVKEIERKEIEQEEKEGSCSDKEWVVVQALIELRSIGLWVCRVVLAVLSGNEAIFTEKELSSSGLINLDSTVAGIIKKGCFLKEVKELKELSGFIAGGGDGGAKGMEEKLEEFEKKMNEIGKEVDSVFSEVLARRNELLNGIRFRK